MPEHGSGRQEPVVLQEDDGTVRLLTLNRPARRNAFDLSLREALAEALEGAATDPAVRAVVLTGAGGSFCSGGDVSTMDDLDLPSVRSRTEVLVRIPAAIRGMEKPVVAAVEGAAFGAGLSLATVCDHVVAARDATFCAVFTRVGLGGDMGISTTLRERVGVARARRMLLLADVVTGPAALEMDLVDDLVEPGEATGAALAVAQRLAFGPPLAIAAIKRQVHAPHRDFATALAAEGDDQVALLLSGDLQEGVAAFRERRPPIFRGA